MISASYSPSIQLVGQLNQERSPLRNGVQRCLRSGCHVLSGQEGTGQERSEKHNEQRGKNVAKQTYAELSTRKPDTRKPNDHTHPRRIKSLRMVGWETGPNCCLRTSRIWGRRR